MFESEKITTLVPHMYKGFLEIDALINVEDDMFDASELEVVSVWNNQFILTADIKGIAYYEKMFDILADPLIETLEFRRQRLMNRKAINPPFTFRFLKNQLDSIIGKDKYSAYINFDTYTLYIESTPEDQNWFHEMRVLMTDIKPANIIFTNSPLIKNTLVLSERILYNKLRANYVLGTLWTMGTHPFISMGADEVIKMSTVSSLKADLFSDVATFTAGDIDHILINDTLSINTFSKKLATDGIVEVEYTVPSTVGAAITNIKIRKSNNAVLSEVIVYVPLTDDVLMKHSLLVKEGS